MLREPTLAGGQVTGRRASVKGPIDIALRYGVAVFAVGVVLLAKLVSDPAISNQSPFLLLSGAVAIGAWFGGLGPGILATAVGAVGADYFFLPPEGSFSVSTEALLPLLLFTLQGLLITALVAALRSARGRAEQSTLEAERHQENLREGEERFRFLAASGATLTSSLDYRTTLANVADLAVPTLADWCAVDVLEEDGSLERLAVEHTDPEKAPLAYELQKRYPPHPEMTLGVRKVFRTNEPDMMAEIPEELLDEYAVDREHREMLRELGLRSYMVVPMVARGRNHGAITLVSAESGRRYSETDLRLAEELARRAALAVDNAKLYEEAQREISERKEAQARLKEAEARFRTLVEHIPAMTYMEAADKYAQSNAFLYISPQIEAVLGYSPEEWMADPLMFRKTLHPDDKERVLAEDARTNRTGEPFQMEYRQRARDGRVVWVRDESVLVRDHEGGAPYWLGVQFDITDRREAEEALRQSEGRYRTVVKQAAEGIFIVDIQTKLILEANAAYRNLLGYTAQDMLGLGLTLYDVVAHDHESIDRYVSRILENRVQFIGERRHRRKDGSIVDVEVGSSVISYGDGEALCVIVHDITERRRSAERLQRSLDALLALYEAGQILSSSLKRDEIGSRLLDIAGRVSNLTAAVIAVPDDEGELRIWRSSGLEGLRHKVRFSPEAIAARERVLQTRKHQAVRLPQSGDDGRTLPRRPQPPSARAGQDHRCPGGLRAGIAPGAAERGDPHKPRQPGSERPRKRPPLRRALRAREPPARPDPQADNRPGGGAPQGLLRGTRRPRPDGRGRPPAAAGLRPPPPP